METKKRGRKPLDDPKEPIRIYVNRSVIKKLGGEQRTQNMALEYIYKQAENKNKSK